MKAEPPGGVGGSRRSVGQHPGAGCTAGLEGACVRRKQGGGPLWAEDVALEICVWKELSEAVLGADPGKVARRDQCIG